MTLAFPDGMVFSLNGFGLLAITTMICVVVVSIGNVLETWLKERRRE